MPIVSGSTLSASANIAATISWIRHVLASAVTVLCAADPVRVFQQFATLDLLSNGRAEIVAGRGSFVEAFPLFGLRLEDYEALFAEKLDLLLTLSENEHATQMSVASLPHEKLMSAIELLGTRVAPLVRGVEAR